ncbi:unnamed protein product [Adineta steineri]|uniref:TIR domain-containing protein n=1 Tax=Adineta steineri TaxID=433720 RepID=A0A819GNX5_9BILA|nr:unnamed protein product [Adineta steineri]
MKLANANGIFQHWDQHMINKFYKYCHDQCVLPNLDQTGEELELVGFEKYVHETKEKWHVLSHLATEKLLRTSTTNRSRSARVHTYNLMLSYCQQDTKKCQHLNKRFIEEGLTVWAEPIVDEQPRDASSQMNKSECIILCISENYYESQSCEKEARHALQTGKPIFLVKVRNDPLFGWQREIFEGKLLFSFFGSDYYLNLQYDHLLLKILQSIKPNNSPSKQPVEQLRSKYDRRVQTLMQIGHIENEEMIMLIQQLQNVIDAVDPEKTESDEQNQETNTDHRDEKKNKGEYGWIERWLRKPTNTTKQNLPPFAFSGDINDAIFPMPEYILQQLGIEDQSLLFTQSSTAKFRNIFERDIIKRSVVRPSPRDLLNEFPVDDEYTYGMCTQRTEYSNCMSQVFTDWHSSTDEDTQNKTRLPCLPAEVFNHSKNKAQKRRDSNRTDDSTNKKEEGVRYIAKKYQPTTRAELDVYFKQFAQRMQENIIQFENFCATAAVHPTGRKKRRTIQ